MAVVSTSRGLAFPPHVCTAQSLCTTLGTKLLWQPIYTKHLTQSISLFEEFLLPRTEKGVLNTGLCTQQAQPPIPTTCLCLFFFLFQPSRLCPFCILHYNDVMFSQVTEENTFDNRGPASIWTACVGSQLSNTRLSQGNRVAPNLPPALGTDGRRSSTTLSLLLPGRTMGQRWRNKENKDQILLQAAWMDMESCLLRDLCFSSPRFSASTPSRLSFNGTM